MGFTTNRQKVKDVESDDEYVLDLDAHEELDEIDRRTNDDGTVEVDLLEWREEGGYAKVKFRTPTGDVKEESMDWPAANNDEYKFIRLINQTPYTLRTAEKINEDDNLTVDADPESWNIETKEEALYGSLADVDRSIFKRFLCFPFAIIVGTIAYGFEKPNSMRSKKRMYPFTDEEWEVHYLHGIIAGTWSLIGWYFLLVFLLALVI